jgi:hypothetical protein
VIDKPVRPMEPGHPATADSLSLIAHALYLGSAITDTASEPSEVIANAKPIADWLAQSDADGADGPAADSADADFDRRLVAAYQQLSNQRGVGCEVHLFVERAQQLYRFLRETPAAPTPPAEAEAAAEPEG